MALLPESFCTTLEGMKYHIFIGSNLDDLKNERRELPRIIMEFGHIPVMTDFLETRNAQLSRDKKTKISRSEQPPIDLLTQKAIKECDYFIALTAHKYSVKGEKHSRLEAEYNLAIKEGIPVLALILDEKARWKAAKKETEAALVKKQGDFRKKLLVEEFHETWVNTADLCLKFQKLLVNAANNIPRPGWVEASQAALPVVANELARLSSENEMLRRLVKIDGGEVISRLRDQMKRALKVLAMNRVKLNFYYVDGENWENTRQFLALHIFKLLAPELVLGKTTAEISHFLGTVLNPDLDKIVRKDYPTPSNTIKKIMTDFTMLKLVKCVNEEDEAAEDEIWEITEYGKELYAAYRMRQMEKGFSRKGEPSA